MAFSFGFYNSKNHDRLYDAIQISMIFDGIILDGIYATIGDHFIVRESNVENQVSVGSGRAWFDHTWNYNDTELLLTLQPPELIMERYDVIILDVHDNEEFRENSITYLTGVPHSTSPEKPILINELGHHQYPLAYIKRRKNASIIEQRDIENTIGSSECPFVTGVLEHIDIDDLLLQWKDQWAKFVLEYEKTASDWQEEQMNDFNVFYTEFKQQLLEFEQSSTKEFDDWFKNVKDVLSGDVAGNLLNLINQNAELEFKRYYGLQSATTIIDTTTFSSKTVVTTTNEESTITAELFKTSDEDGNKRIIETVNPNDGNFKYVKTTIIRDSPNIGKAIEESYEKIAKGG